ncbi:MAG: hypothetical protein ACRD45_18785 [Bryobacteraceae bacterium]
MSPATDPNPTADASTATPFQDFRWVFFVEPLLTSTNGFAAC